MVEKKGKCINPTYFECKQVQISPPPLIHIQPEQANATRSFHPNTTAPTPTPILTPSTDSPADDNTRANECPIQPHHHQRWPQEPERRTPTLATNCHVNVSASPNGHCQRRNFCTKHIQTVTLA
jgi:BRCT domain type II-containing protein